LHQVSPGFLAALKEHCGIHCGRECKVVVWAHNCHVSNARNTEICWRWNEINTGQLVKETFGDKAFSIGFT
jgi:erythromycin esterase-like protein